MSLKLSSLAAAALDKPGSRVGGSGSDRPAIEPDIALSKENAADPRPVILVFTEFYSPGFKAGGPIRSISNLVEALGHEFRFRIVTCDRDLGDHEGFPGVVSNRWVPLGKAEVIYLPPGLRGLFQLLSLLASVDARTVLYLNSFFNNKYSILAVLLRRFGLVRPRAVVLAPHGEFSPGALRVKSGRKRWYFWIARSLGFYNRTIWHASTPLEAADVQRVFEVRTPPVSEPDYTGGTLFTALDIVSSVKPPAREQLRKQVGQLRIAFLGRCSRMKNLSGALRMLAGLEGDISFNIHGPLEDPVYWEECQALIAQLPPNIRVTYLGGIEHTQVASVLAAHHLLFLPTFGEGFGHVISEALSAGCPVLLSDQTPWRNLEEAGVGWDIPLEDEERFRSALRQCVAGDDEWFAAFSRRASAYAAAKASDPATVEDNRRLFRAALTS